MAVVIINDLSTSTINFTLAFPQVDLDIDVFMELPMGCVGPNGDCKGHVLKLNKSLLKKLKNACSFKMTGRNC